ncbi:MAG: sialate O-acetylesterase [Chthoniobacter sp.]|jgi:sialate O-acetylesterase|nr:sialate O-acetylesterase [Chthoniobacter sp.]
MKKPAPFPMPGTPFLCRLLIVLLAAGSPVARAVDAPAKKEKDPNARECVIAGGAAEWGSRGLRTAGETFAIKANAPAKDMAFVEWVGNVGVLADFKSPETTLTMPANWPWEHVKVAAAYKRVAPKRFVHALFQDHMVLQRGVIVPVWGWAEPGKEVMVEFAGQTVKATAGKDGKWLARLAPLEAGGPHTLKISGPESRTINDVMVGDVWLCSGQSNMAGSGPGAEELATANLPNIRLFQNNPGPNEYDGTQPFDDLADAKNGWVQCSPEKAKSWSRVAFFFGRAIHEHHKVPLGLIVSAMDGSFIEGWMPRATLESMPEYMAGGKFTPDYNLSWGGGQMPYIRYNAHIAPLAPFALRGVLWYQGESNGSIRSALRYRSLLTSMIRDWRAAFAQEKLPFVVIQMHLFGKLETSREPGKDRVPWAELQESQLAVARTVPNVGCAVTVDLAREQSLHPPDKRSISERAALVARKVAYGEDVTAYGPLYKSMQIEQDKVRVNFESSGGGLVAKGGEPLKYFLLAGEDRKWTWADGKIEGEAVLVSSPRVRSPIAVRYAWGSGQQEANLFNQAGLPAAPFRTDDWSPEDK